MRQEISHEELKQLPGYEIRAHVFMERVEKMAEQTVKDHSSDLFVIAKDAYEADRNLSDAEIERIKEFNKEIGIDWLPPEQRGEMVVRIDASCDSWKPIKEFVRKTFDLARQQGGRINGNTKPPSDEEIEKLITKADINPPHYYVFVSYLMFTFDEHLPGSI